MKKLITFLLFVSAFFTIQTNAQDWRNAYEFTNFEKYKKDNQKFASLAADEKRIVFMGNSITEAWPIKRPSFFENSAYIGRGISGQTTSQMLLRFRKDVINLSPKVVVILAGINDIAGNTGYTPVELIAENIKSMAELARYHKIKVVLCAVLPAIDFPWNPGLKPADRVIELNTILEKYAKQNDIPYVDYHTAMKDENNGLKVPEFTSADDLVHPNEAGYILMEKLVQPAIKKAIGVSTVSLNPFFTDHMVLQQKTEAAIWGKAPAGQEVKIKGSWGSQGSATADKDGNWSVNLNTPKAGGPYQIDITSTNIAMEINDVMIGEVWLASGQSNMQMPLKGWPPNDPIKDSEQEIANAQSPKIRMFTVARNYSFEEEDSFKGKWEVCKPETAKDFSASAYFFARRLHQELNVPIGIIHSSWGGTPAEAWTSKHQIKTLGDFDEVISVIEDPNRKKATREWFSKWEKRAVPTEVEDWNDLDLGHYDIAKSGIEADNWTRTTLPGRLDLYKDQDFDGVFWFKKTIEVEDISSDYTFVMGPADDTDLVFVNGEKIGATSYKFSEGRKYPIKKSILKKGKNEITIRIIDTGGPGSISGDLKLVNGLGNEISLAGEWYSMITAEIYNGHIYQYGLGKGQLSQRPNIVYPNPYATPSLLYNAMIHPLVPYTIKGAIWYQGESNVGRAEQYKRLFPMMIKDWRTQWNDNFPFYFVQIAPFNYQNSGGDKSQKLRDAQRQTLSLEKTGMVVTLDIGNNTNIHPANKQDVGSRLAGLALSNDYGKNIVASGPLYKSHFIKRKNIFIEFDFVGTGLMIKDSKLSGFEIAGADKKFVAAKAKIVGDKIKVCAKGISKPKYVRYAWRDTSKASLFNKEGLPASPFSMEN